MRWEEITGGSVTDGSEAKSGPSLNFMILWFDFDETLDIRALSVQNSLASLEALRSQLVSRGLNSDHNEDI